MELEGGAGIARVLQVRLVGEIVTTSSRDAVFQRGVSRYPALGAPVTTVTNTDLLTVYAPPRYRAFASAASVRTTCSPPT
jgi:hypothetical protein